MSKLRTLKNQVSNKKKIRYELTGYLICIFQNIYLFENLLYDKHFMYIYGPI